ncbi:MAG TPA: hypothetical protein VFJ43_14475, partial [Bacteroidia bacterium]|nr:hypothetical protein [Bacteroidia bacterium]
MRSVIKNKRYLKSIENKFPWETGSKILLIIFSFLFFKANAQDSTAAYSDRYPFLHTEYDM